MSAVLPDADRQERVCRGCGSAAALDVSFYSSLAYLTQLPLKQLKIDQSFVRNIGIKQSDAAIIQTIIGMANNLGMEVIAEGVETQVQRDFLEENGCLFYQGYLFSKPVPVDQFEALLISPFKG